MRVIKRKKGNEKYFYLQHSFRKGTKIKTKEIYLGKEIPKNLKEIEEKFKHEFQKDTYKKLENIKKNFQKEWKRVPENMKKKELEEISIAFTYNTNAIEGSTITLEETREIIQDDMAPNKPLYDVKETEKHNKVFLRMLEKKEEITNSLLLGWHKEVFSETKPNIAGKYREYLVRVGNYVAPDWQDVKKLMNELLKNIKNKDKLNPVELAGKIHYRFESIHPFCDGNGRIGRLLMNYILWHSGYPMLIVEYKKRKSYYKALTKGTEGFVSYFIRRYLSVHKRRIK